jgi:hypothetical protein
VIQVVWEFVIKPEAVGRFEQAYGPGGEWARLFDRYPGFRGTTLLRDAAHPRRYLTIDCWVTERHRDDMLTRAKDEYSRLDEGFSEWTESEAEVGTFEVMTRP